MLRAGNFYESTLAAELASGASTISLTSLVGLPEFSSPDYAYLIIGNPDEIATCEIVKLTANTGSGAQPVTRAQDGTAAATWAAGTMVFCAVNAAALADLQTLIAARIAAPAAPDEDDVLKYSGGAWVAAAAAAGGVLQSVQGTLSTSTVTTNTTMTDTGLSAAITPTSAASKILAICTFSGGAYLASSGSMATAYFDLYRGDTALLNVLPFSVRGDTDSLQWLGSAMNCAAILDSPGVETEITYKLKFKASAGCIARVCDGNSKATLILLELAA